jgi:hypothetical protein
MLEKEIESFKKHEVQLSSEKGTIERQKALQEKQTQKALDLAKDNSDQVAIESTDWPAWHSRYGRLMERWGPLSSTGQGARAHRILFGE